MENNYESQGNIDPISSPRPMYFPYPPPLHLYQPRPSHSKSLLLVAVCVLYYYLNLRYLDTEDTTYRAALQLVWRYLFSPSSLLFFGVWSWLRPSYGLKTLIFLAFLVLCCHVYWFEVTRLEDTLQSEREMTTLLATFRNNNFVQAWGKALKTSEQEVLLYLVQTSKRLLFDLVTTGRKSADNIWNFIKSANATAQQDL